VSTAVATNILFLPPPPFGLTDVDVRSAPTLADLDGDGDQDAFLGAFSGDTFYFENTGTATGPAFAAASTNPFGLTNVGSASIPTFADLDGDGDLDAFIGELGGDTFYFENTGSSVSPLFAVVSANPFGLTNVGSSSEPTFADLDGDGDLDAFVGEYTGDTIYFENSGTSTSPAFAAASANPFGLSSVLVAGAPSFADLDGDGDLDAFIGELYGALNLFENTGSATSPAFLFNGTDPFGLVDVGNSNVPAFSDIDGDGDVDALIGDAGGLTFYFENTGTATSPAFAAASANPFSLTDVGSSSMPTFADLDGDGDLDAFIGEYFGTVQFFENTGTVTSPAFAAALANPFGLADVGFRSAPTFADLDGDGDLDAFIGENSGDTFYFENTGTSTSPAFAAVSADPFGLAGVGFRGVPTFTDVDGDGDLDAFIGESNGTSFYFQNTGSPTNPAFASSASNPFGLADVGNESAPTFTDVDGDGDLDAFIGERYGTMQYFENTGTATGPAFAAASANPFGLADVGSHSAPTFADLDGDGDMDAFIGEDTGGTFFFENATEVVLPVELTAFTALSDTDAILLQWETQSETNNAGFDIELRPEQANHWRRMAFVEGGGTTNESRSYRYRLEGLAPGSYRFRLKQRDFDGSFQYSAEIEVAVAAPVQLVVEQNYPNPFRASTEITYALPVAGHVRLLVYDVQGREVARLVDGQEAAGEHRVSWSAGTLPSGLYVYRLEAGSHTVSRTMMLVR